MTSNETAEKILQTLKRQKFADWYFSGNFDKYIRGDWGDTTEILQQIKEMFGLPAEDVETRIGQDVNESLKALAEDKQRTEAAENLLDEEARGITTLDI